jgi:hypothetical protein
VGVGVALGVGVAVGVGVGVGAVLDDAELALAPPHPAAFTTRGNSNKKASFWPMGTISLLPRFNAPRLK